MIPEQGTRQELKRILFAFYINPDHQDILLQAVMERNGLNAHALGRTGTADRYHYASTISFSVPRFIEPIDVYAMLRRAANESFMWLNRWEITQIDASWRYGIATFFGMTPCGDVRGKYYDAPPYKHDPRMAYALKVAERLKADAEAENRRSLLELEHDRRLLA